MRSPRKALFLTLILLSVIIHPFLAIVPQVKSETSINLWVNSFTGEFVEWDTEQGASPYLNDDYDSWIHEKKSDGAIEGYFGFEDTELSGIINSVTLYMECYGEGNNDQINVYIDSNDGNNYDLEGTITVRNQIWYDYEILVCSSLDSWAEINFTSMQLEYIKKKDGGGDAVYVRRAYLKIDYYSETELGLLDESEGDYIESWDISSESTTALSLTTDGTNIWIIDYIADEVYKYNMTGGYIDSWDTSSESGDAFGITTDGLNIWLADNSDLEVYKYTMAGVYVDSWDTSGQGIYLYGIATDGNYIWTVDWLAKEVYKYSMSGVYTDEHWDTSVQTADSTDITTDGDYIRIVSPDDAEVYKYHMNGTYITSWDISVQSDDGNGITTNGIYIWIVDYVDDEIYKYEGPTPPAPPTPPDPTNLFGAGFNASTPYVELHWTHNLTNTDFFEIQNSTDKLSWDYLGQNTTTQYTDFQVVNGTERYYKVRACNYEAVGGWSNSSFSSVNFEKVYFISEVGEVSCKIQANNVSSIAVIAGILNDGNLASTYVVDGDWYNVSEVVQTPGLDVRFNFTDIAGDPNCGCLDVYHSYTGHPQHDIKIQVWNFTSSSWYQIGTLIYNETAGWECSGLGNYAEHFFQNGSFWGRFYHTSQGHTPHEVQIDRINLDIIYGEECPPCPPCEEVAPAQAMGKYYALAIILLILGILLGLGMRKRW